MPKHAGGSDDECNLTYLSVREHIIAHFLLWKINRDVNDLRSMYMLGGRLTAQQRSIIGKWCYVNKIGIHGLSKVEMNVHRRKGIETQMKSKIGLFTDDVELRSMWASLGGKASIVSPNNPWSYWASPEARSHRASLGGKSLSGYVCVFRPGDKSFKRIKKEQLEEYLSNGYTKGSPFKPMKGQSGSTHQRKRVSDGKHNFDSIKIAAEHYGVSSALFCGWLKKKQNWCYISCEDEP